MSDLATLLQQEYNTEGPVSDECREKTIEYITSNIKVEHEDVIFIKHLTKIASIIIKNGDLSLKKYLERIYKYNLAGIKKIETETFEDLSPDNIQLLHSHFYSHASNIAMKLYDFTKNVKWCVKACMCSEQSALLSENVDRVHAGKAYSFAAELALSVFKANGNIEWAEKAFDFAETSAFLVVDQNLVYCADAYAAALLAAKDLYNHYKEIEWAERWYDCAVEAARLNEKDVNQFAFASNMAAYAAEELFKRTGNLNWVKRWYNQEIQSANSLKGRDPKSAAYRFGFAGDAARTIFNYKEDLQWIKQNMNWMKKHYHASRLSGDLSADFDEKHSAVSYDFAGDAALLLACFETDLSKKQEWAAKGIECYSKFISYCRKNPGITQAETRNKIAGEHRSTLKRILKQQA